MRCRDFVAGLLLAGAGRRRATRRVSNNSARAPPHGAASSGRPMSRCVHETDSPRISLRPVVEGKRTQRGHRLRSCAATLARAPLSHSRGHRA